MFEKIGNIEKVLKKAFDICDSNRCPGSIHYTEAEDVLKSICLDAGFRNTQRCSWFSQKIAILGYPTCTAWHRDEIDDYFSHLCIVSCNNPTQYLEYGSGFWVHIILVIVLMKIKLKHMKSLKI